MGTPAIPVRDTGVCYGFELRSSFPLTYVRTGVALPLDLGPDSMDDPVDGEVMWTWDPIDGVREACTLTRLSSSLFDVEYERLRFRIATDPWRLTTPPTQPWSPLVESAACGTSLAVAATLRGDLATHAASVEVDGSGILLIAPGTHGKTTLAAAFHAAGHRLLSDDASVCSPAALPLVYPGPAIIRMRPDVVDNLIIDGVTPVYSSPQRTHLSLDDHRRGDGDPVPLRAIVFLREEHDTIRLEHTPAHDVTRDLYGMSFYLRGEAGRRRCFEHAATMSQIPAWSLYRPLRFDALDDVIAAVTETCLR